MVEGSGGGGGSALEINNCSSLLAVSVCCSGVSQSLTLSIGMDEASVRVTNVFRLERAYRSPPREAQGTANHFLSVQRQSRSTKN